jgi:hypothetical protein
MGMDLRGAFDTGKTIRGIVLLPLTWLVTCAFFSLLSQDSRLPHLSVVMWFSSPANPSYSFASARAEHRHTGLANSCVAFSR